LAHSSSDATRFDREEEADDDEEADVDAADGDGEDAVLIFFLAERATANSDLHFLLPDSGAV
jgi:hypothetical protein